MFRTISQVSLGVGPNLVSPWVYVPAPPLWQTPQRYAPPFLLQRPIHDLGIKTTRLSSAPVPQEASSDSGGLNLREGWKRYIGYLNEMATPFKQASPFLFKGTMVTAIVYSVIDAWERGRQVKAETLKAGTPKMAQRNQWQQFCADVLFHTGATVFLPVLLIEQVEKSAKSFLPKLFQKLPTSQLTVLSKGIGLGMIAVLPKLLDPVLEHGLKPLYPKISISTLSSTQTRSH